MLPGFWILNLIYQGKPDLLIGLGDALNLLSSVDLIDATFFRDEFAQSKRKLLKVQINKT